MALQEAPRRARIHPVLTLKSGDALSGQGGAPRPIVYRVGELMGASGAALIEQHPDHLRHAALLHAVEENGSVTRPQARQCATEAVSEIDDWIVLLEMSCVPGRQQHPPAKVHLASPRSE